MTPASRYHALRCRSIRQTSVSARHKQVAASRCRFLAEEVNDGVNVDEQQQQQHSGPATSASAAADVTSARSATCKVCLLVHHFPVRNFQVVHFQSPTQTTQRRSKLD